MDEEKIIEILSKVSLFQGLKKRQLQGLADRFIDRSYETGVHIVKQGDVGYGFCIVVSGAAEAVRERADGTQVQVNVFGPSDFFGELALLDDGPRTASVIATEPTECLILPRWNFLSALKKDTDTAISIMQELAKRFRTTLDALT